MIAKEYIIRELDRFLEKFTNVRVRYEYDINALTHVVEIVPNSIYHLDKKYIVWELEMLHNFTCEFPTENICFISDDAIVGIENPIFVKEGLSYAEFSTTNQSPIPFEMPNINSLSLNISFNTDNEEQTPIKVVNIKSVPFEVTQLPFNFQYNLDNKEQTPIEAIDIKIDDIAFQFPQAA